MENGVEPNPEPQLDALHSATVAEANGTIPPAELASAVDQSLPAVGSPSPDAGAVKEILAAACAYHAETVHDEFFDDLCPRVGEDKAERIANRAAMSPTLQAAISTHGARVLDKHGLSKYVNDEGVLVGALLAYWKELNRARRDRDKILKGQIA